MITSTHACDAVHVRLCLVRYTFTNARYKEFLQATSYQPKVGLVANGVWRASSSRVRITVVPNHHAAAPHRTVLAPQDTHNFLRDWSNGTFPGGRGNRPVTWVSLPDAAAACTWAGGRLPHEWEWQYAAQVRRRGDRGSATAHRRCPWLHGEPHARYGGASVPVRVPVLAILPGQLEPAVHIPMG